MLGHPKSFAVCFTQLVPNVFSILHVYWVVEWVLGFSVFYFFIIFAFSLPILKGVYWYQASILMLRFIGIFLSKMYLKLILIES